MSTSSFILLFIPASNTALETGHFFMNPRVLVASFSITFSTDFSKASRVTTHSTTPTPIKLEYPSTIDLAIASVFGFLSRNATISFICPSVYPSQSADIMSITFMVPTITLPTFLDKSSVVLVTSYFPRGIPRFSTSQNIIMAHSVAPRRTAPPARKAFGVPSIIPYLSPLPSNALVQLL